MPLGWSPQKNIAMTGKFGDPTGGGPGDFGISTSLGGKAAPKDHTDRNHVPKHMPDNMRAARPPIASSGRMHNQANPDHGPHKC